MVSRSIRSVTAEVDSILGPTPAHYAQPEAVVLRFRRHGRRIVLPVLALIAIAGVAGFWVGRLPEAWMNILAGSGAALGALVLGLIPILAWLAARTTVTTRRVIVRSGLFARHRAEVPLGRVREVRSRRSLGQRLAGSGTIELLHGVEKVELEDVPAVAETAEALQELMERSFVAESRAQQSLAAASAAQPQHLTGSGFGAGERPPFPLG